jgi:hypothetical protein
MALRGDAHCKATPLEGLSWPIAVQSSIMLKFVGYLATSALAIVSVATNARFGWTLGASPLDRAAYVATSVAIDVFKVSLPLLAMPLWANRHRALAVCAIAMWLGCITWSANAALGFVATTRSETVAQRIADAKARTGWEATVERAEREMAHLARHRPAAVVRAELNAAVVVGPVWQRSKQCTEITLDESRAACVEVLRLRQELATAEAAERLEGKVVAGRTHLATVSVAGADADPQATALASLIGVDQTAIRAGIALLLALILEAGSALGFAIVATTTKGIAPTATADHPSPRKPSTTRHTDLTGLRVSDDHIRRWALSELDIDADSYVPARRAHESFCSWARGQGIDAPTETYFGRQLTKEIALLGGRKRRTRNATVYSGIALADRQALVPSCPKPGTTPLSALMVAFGGKQAKPRLDRHDGGGSPVPATRPLGRLLDDRSHHGERLPTQRRERAPP